MKGISELAAQMRSDWDRRVRHDYRFWMSDGYRSDEEMWQSGERDLLILTRDIAEPKTKTFVEVGCGVGRLLRAASNRFKNVIGVDISSEAVEKARTFLKDATNVQLVLGNGIDLKEIPDQSIDCVGVYAALCSVPTEIVAKYLIEINRILKPQGTLRMQVYVGTEQPVGQEDTLHLRCYNEENLKKAYEKAGFSMEWLEELILPIQVSFKEIGVTAKITSLQKITSPTATAEEVAKILLPEGEAEGKVGDGNVEYWMTLNYAKDLAQKGDVDTAKQALNYALDMSQAVTVDVSDMLSKIVSEVNSAHSSPLKVRQTNDGPVCIYHGQHLDHGEKPKLAAENWVKRALQEKRLIDCEEIVVVGFGFGYHLEELVRQTNKKISVIEPIKEIFEAAKANRNLSDLLNKLHTVSIGAEYNSSPLSENSELLIRPQSLVIYKEEIPKIKERFYGLRGLKALHPNIMVLGPMQGGTLPITGYTTRGLLSLHQRVRELDMSPFNQGYLALKDMLREPVRQNVMFQNYIETLSQSVIESVNERKVDILICMAQAPISGRALTELRAKGIITVLWFMEDYLRFHYWREMAKFYDFVFTIQKGECLDLIKQAGAGEVHYVPVGCDPISHCPLELSAEEKQKWGSPISFVGAGYHNRQQVFASFAEMPFKLWGTEWPGCRPFDRMLQESGRRLAPEEYIKIFNSTDININLHSSTERDGVDPSGDFVNPRTFELAACGAFQLVDERSLLADCFVPGEEVITFKDVKELKEKITYYQDRPEERRSIAARGRARAISDHTYAHRLKEMLSIIYSSKFEHLKKRQETGGWAKMLERSKRYDELHNRCMAAYQRGEEANLDGLVVDILVGQGKLTETEQKLLFLHHVRKQIIRMKNEESGQL